MAATIAGTTPPTLTYRPHKPYLCERPAPRELLEQSVGNRLYHTHVARQRQRRGSAPTTATKHLQRRDSNAPTDKHERFVRWPFNINGWFTIWPFDESFHLDRPAEPRHLVIPAAQNSHARTRKRHRASGSVDTNTMTMAGTLIRAQRTRLASSFPTLGRATCSPARKALMTN